MNIKNYTNEQLIELASDIRNKILNSVSKNGGHLASNLAVVESTIALFKVFDFPNDSLIFDVGHQCYTYKVLSDRPLDNLRKEDGISGFQNTEESEFDYYDTGHSSTSISVATGRALSFKLNNESHESIAYIGDGSMGNGLTYEAINHLATLDCKVIIVINDNNMSISPTVGITESYLNNNKLRMLLRGNFTYIDNVDGHNFESLLKAFTKAKKSKKSVIVHIKTIKGKGYSNSENDKVGTYHKVTPFNLETGVVKGDNSSKFIGHLTELLKEEMENNPNAVIITAATTMSSQILKLRELYPDRFYDVGMAEEHALLFAVGLATNGIHPYVFMHSSFSQRGYDQFIHDIARGNNNVTVIIDRIGISRGDGKTHQGIYDLGYLYSIPNLTVATPSNSYELEELFNKAKEEKMIIRLPEEDCPTTKQFYIHNPEHETILISYGPIIHKLEEAFSDTCDILNLVYQKPIDKSLLRRVCYRYKKAIIIDQFGTKQGFVKEVKSIFNELDFKGTIHSVSLDDKFYEARSDSRYGIIENSRIKKIIEG